MSGSLSRRAGVVLLALVVGLVVVDLAAWGAHVRWRTASAASLDPVTQQIDRLAAQLAEDDEWIERNARLTQQYAVHDQFAERLESRGRRRVAYNALVDAYNDEIVRLYTRFYLAPMPAPSPPVRDRWDP